MTNAIAMTPETIGHIVTQGGLPCTLYNAAQTRRGGVLVPAQKAEPVVFFTTPRDARRAITRTTRVAKHLKDSPLMDGWLRIVPLFTGQPYEITPVMRSHVAAKTEAAQ